MKQWNRLLNWIGRENGDFTFGTAFSREKRSASYYCQNDVTKFICCGDLVR